RSLVVSCVIGRILPAGTAGHVACVFGIDRIVRWVALDHDIVGEGILHRPVRGDADGELPVGLRLVMCTARGVGVVEGRLSASGGIVVVEGDDVVDLRGLGQTGAA